MKLTFYYSQQHRIQMDRVNLYAPARVTTRPYFRGRLYTDAMQKGRPPWKDAMPVGSGDINEVTVR